MEVYQSMSDINEMDYQEYRSIVKTFLNDINDSIYLLKQNGYDTKDLYVVYDMLRYEVLSDKNIAILYRQGRGQEIVQKLKTYNGLVSDLTEQLNASRELKNEHDEELNKINSKIKSLRKPEKSLDTSDMFNGIVSIALAATTFLTAKISYYLYKSEFSVPQTEYYKVDTENNVSESKEFIKDTPEAEVLIEEYLETDNSGHRIKRVYSLNPTADMDINSEELMDIDLSKLKPISEEMVLDKKINDLNKDYYRVLKSTQINEEEKGIAKGEIAYKIFIITACTIIGLSLFN